MPAKIAIVIPEQPHPQTVSLAQELYALIPEAELAEEGEIMLRFVEDVGPQFLSINTSSHQFVFKIISFKSRSDLGLKTVIKKENSQLVLNNFTTDLGISVAEAFMSLFPVDTESNQVVNFTVHKDFIYFRMYRFCFKAKGLVMDNIGPHITLRLWRMTQYEGESKKTQCFKKYVKNLNLL